MPNRETWILVIEGRARIGLISASVGDAVFVEGDRAGIEVGPDGMSGLIAYPGPDPIDAVAAGSRRTIDQIRRCVRRRSPKPKEIVEVQT